MDRLMIPKWSRRGLLSLAVGLGLLPGTSNSPLAQESEAPSGVTRPQAETEETDRLVLPVFRVVGDKLNRPMQDVPQSVSVFSGEELLRRAGTTSAKEAFLRTPNVSIGEPGNGSFQIRGINNNSVVRTTDTGANSSITVLSNSVPVSFNSADMLPPTLWDVRSVEIFKGPQSVTQGPNSLAGAVLFNYNEPSFEYDGRARVTYGRFDTFNAAVTQNFPVIDDLLALRVSFERNASDGHIDNETLDRDDFAMIDRDTFRGQVLLRPLKTDDLRALLTVSSDWFRGNLYPTHGGYAPFSERINNADARNRQNIWGTTAGLEVTARVSDAIRLTSVSGINYLDTQQFFEPGNSPVDDGLIEFRKDEKVLSQELRANYNIERLRVVLGVFGQYGEYLSDLDFALPGAPGTGSFIEHLGDERWNIAFFGDAEYDLTERFSIGAGVRVHHEEYRVTMAQNPFGLGDSADSVSQADTVPLPTFHMRYQLFEPLAVGFLFSRGFRSGGGSVTYAPLPVVAVPAYDPEYTWNYELFLRSQWLDGSLQVDGNVFFVDWNDMILTTTVPGALGSFDTVTHNAGAAEVYGFEVQASYAPLPGLRLPLGVGWSSTEFTDFQFLPDRNLAGQAFPNAPEWSMVAGLDYTLPNGLFVSTTFSWRDSTYAQTEDPGGTRLETRELLNLKLGYETEHWSIYLIGSNLLDDDYATLLYEAAGAPYISGSTGYPWELGFGVEAYW